MDYLEGDHSSGRCLQKGQDHRGFYANVCSWVHGIASFLSIQASSKFSHLYSLRAILPILFGFNETALTAIDSLMLAEIGGP